MVPIPDAILNARIHRRTLSLAAVSMALGACGGGGGSSPPAPPQILVQPASISVEAGSTASFQVSVQHSGSVVYQWFRNGVAIPGANAATLTLPAVFFGDSGNTFSVAVSAADGAASATSSTATLLVKDVYGDWVEGIALATGALAQHPHTVGFSKSNDLFISIPPSYPASSPYIQTLTRAAPDGAPVPLIGEVQSLNLGDTALKRTSLQVLEHSDGNLYVSTGFTTSRGLGSSEAAGGKIHKLSKDGTHSVIYDSEKSDLKITPFGITECPDGQICTWDIKTLVLYKIATNGVLKEFSRPFFDPRTYFPFGYHNTEYTRMSLTATHGGDAFAAVTTGRESFIFKISPDGTAAPVNFGDIAVYALCAFKEHVYALTIAPGDLATWPGTGTTTLIRRAPDGSLERIAGGVALDLATLPPGTSEIGLGPLPGRLSWRNSMIGATSTGRIAMYIWEGPADKRTRQNFLVTPPAL